MKIDPMVERKAIRDFCERQIVLHRGAKNHAKGAAYGGSTRANLAEGMIQVLDQIEHKKRLRLIGHLKSAATEVRDRLEQAEGVVDRFMGEISEEALACGVHGRSTKEEHAGSDARLDIRHTPINVATNKEEENAR